MWACAGVEREKEDGDAARGKQQEERRMGKFGDEDSGESGEGERGERLVHGEPGEQALEMTRLGQWKGAKCGGIGETKSMLHQTAVAWRFFGYVRLEKSGVSKRLMKIIGTRANSGLNDPFARC